MNADNNLEKFVQELENDEINHTESFNRSTNIIINTYI